MVTDEIQKVTELEQEVKQKKETQRHRTSSGFPRHSVPPALRWSRRASRQKPRPGP